MNVVTFRLEIERMSQSIQASVMDREQTIAKEIEKAVAAYLEDDRWKHEIATAVENTMREAIRRAVQGAISEALYRSTALKEVVERETRNAIEAVLAR